MSFIATFTFGSARTSSAMHRQHAPAIRAPRVVELDHGDVAERIALDRIGRVVDLLAEPGDGGAGGAVLPLRLVRSASR